jgi:hypothetical protein
MYSVLIIYSSFSEFKISHNYFPSLNSVNSEQCFTPPDDFKYTVVNFDFIKAKRINKGYYATNFPPVR